MTENEFPSLQDLPSEARVLVISPSYRQVSRRRNAHRVMLDTPQVRRYPLFSSPDNQIGGTEEQDQDSQQSPVSPPPPPDEPQIEPSNIKQIKKVLGKFLYYSHGVDLTMLTALNEIAVNKKYGKF